MARDTVYEPIKRDLIRRMSSGKLKPGDRVPSENDLVTEFGVSRSQTRMAMRELELERWLVRHQGKGTFVAERTTGLNTMGIGLAEKTVAVSFPQYNSVYTQRIAEGILRGLSDAGYQAIIYNLRMKNTCELRFLEEIRSSAAEGLLLWPQHGDKEICQLVSDMVQNHFPVVCVDRSLPNVPVDFVSSDNESIGYHLTRKLLKRGRHHIAFAGERMDLTSVTERYEGYRRAMLEAGHNEEDLCWIGMCGKRIHSEQLHAVLARREKPEAFVCLHDLVSVALQDSLQELGYSVPGDMELASTDDEHFATKRHTSVVAFDQDALGIGRESVRLLLNRIRQPTLPQQKLLLPHSVIE